MVLRPIKRESFTRAGDHIQRDHIVSGLAVTESARAACIVSDHAADGAAVVRRRIWSKAQAVRGSCGLQRCLHHAWLDSRRTPLRIYLQNRRQVARRIDDQSRPDGIAGARCAGSPRGHRDADGPRRLQDGCRFFDGPRLGNGLRHDAVEGGVSGVERAGELGDIEEVIHAAAPQL